MRPAMKHGKMVGLVLAVVFVAVFVPLVPATMSSGHFLSVQYKQTASESPSYYAFHCGSYINPQVSAQVGSGFSAVYQLSKGYSFSCSYNAG